MSNTVLILILLGGVAALFAAGSLVSHLFKLDHKYDEMMDNGGNFAGAGEDRSHEKTLIENYKLK